MTQNQRGEAGGRKRGPFSWLSRPFAAQPAATPEFLRVINVDRHAEIGNAIEVAGSAARRSKGLLGRTGLAQGEGLWIVPCEAIHTFGMKFPIDLVYLDRRRRVIKVRHSVGPARMSACLRAHSVIELRSGTVDATRTQPGDHFEFEAAPAPSGEAFAGSVGDSTG